jgi:hypothetical protein
LYAIALTVVVELTAIGPPYTVPAVEVGVVPSVVYRIVAPGVVVDSVTLCVLVYIPGEGASVGAATVPGPPSPPPPPQPMRNAARRSSDRFFMGILLWLDF